MADSKAHIGYGAHLQKGDGNSPENFIDVIGIKSLTPPQMKRDSVEITDMDSPQGWKEFIGGMTDGGEASFQGNFIPRDATQNQTEGGLMAEFDKTSCDSLGNWRMTLPFCEGDSEGYYEFTGFLTGLTPTIPLDGVMELNGTIKISGRPQLVLLES